MASNETNEPSSDPAGPPDDEEALRGLEERLERVSQAAERLLADAAERVGRRPPAAGWQQPSDGDGAAARGGGELELLLGMLGSLRDLVPAELHQRLADAVRELLLALRALIDWYLERGERRRAAPSRVQDIPIL